MNPEDPFLVVHREVVALLTSTRGLLTSYLRIRSTASSTRSPELAEARKELEAALSDVSADLHDLNASVVAVEGDPYRYGLDVAEVSRRRGLVHEVANEIEAMRREVEGVVVGAQDQSMKSSGNGKFGGAADETMGDNEDAYEEFEQQRQMELLHEQDEALDGVFRTVGNLRQQADVMGRELEEQGELLDTTDVLVDRVGGKLQTGLKRVAWVIKNNEDTWSGCCIGVLIFVLILLLVLVIIL